MSASQKFFSERLEAPSDQAQPRCGWKTCSRLWSVPSLSTPVSAQVALSTREGGSHLPPELLTCSITSSHFSSTLVLTRGKPFLALSWILFFFFFCSYSNLPSTKTYILYYTMISFNLNTVISAPSAVDESAFSTWVMASVKHSHFSFMRLILSIFCAKLRKGSHKQNHYHCQYAKEQSLKLDFPSL